MAGQNIEKKYLMCYIPIKILKQYAIPNSSLQNLKIYSSKGSRKTCQNWIMYVANTAILEHRFFNEGCCFRLWVFASTSKYFYYWDWRVLLQVLRGKWCQDLQKPCSIILRFVLTNHIYVYCRLAHLTGVFKNLVDLVLYIIGSD